MDDISLPFDGQQAISYSWYQEVDNLKMLLNKQFDVTLSVKDQ